MRRMTLGFVLMCLCASSVQAGLQSALQNALTPLSIPLGQERVSLASQNVTLHGVLNPSVLVTTIPVRLPPIPEGALFIDPVTSTRGEGVFREGPDFEYNPITGSVTISAPPMLGPADEFGVRHAYSPDSVTIYAEGFFTDAPTIPQVTKYRRGEPDYSRPDWQQRPFADNEPSFVIDNENDSINLYVTSESMDISLRRYRRSFSSAEVEFSSLLASNLNADVFTASAGGVLDNSIWPYLYDVEGALPDVHFVVNYETDYRSEYYPERYSLLAVPSEGVFSNPVPEPSSIVLAGFSLAMLLLNQRRRAAV